MDFQTACELSREIVASEPDLLIIGFRRMRLQDEESWAIDIMNGTTARLATVDEKDLLEVRIAELMRDPRGSQSLRNA